jgi:two-component system OmpR family response regulator
MHTLLVEDDDVIVDAITTYLTTKDMAEDHVSTLSAAETFVQISHFDLWVLDLDLPYGY